MYVVLAGNSLFMLAFLVTFYFLLWRNPASLILSVFLSETAEMPGRKESTGSRPALVCTASRGAEKDSPYSRAQNGKLSSSSDHLIPIAPRMTAMHDTRFTYRPVMRQGQQAMYQYHHGMAGHGIPMHAPNPYQTYYNPRSLMLSSSSTGAPPDNMVPPGMSYSPSAASATTAEHPHVPVGMAAAGAYSYAMSPWQAPAVTGSRKRKATRGSLTTIEKELSPDHEQSDESVDVRDKKRERPRSIVTSKSLADHTVAENGDIDAKSLAVSTSAATTNGSSSTPNSNSGSSSNDKLSPSAVAVTSSPAKISSNDDDAHRFQTASPIASDDEDRVFRSKSVMQPLAQSLRAPSQVGTPVTNESTPNGSVRRTPDTAAGPASDESCTVTTPGVDNACRFPPGACKKVYSPSGSQTDVTENSIEPLSSMHAPAGLELTDQVQHYKKALSALHERLHKEHELCQQVSSQRIRAEMMWEAVAQELRQLRVHLARLATQPLPTAMASSMQLP
ncbi:uncharacterized protein LOC135816219 isoform X2 [Sycon ciliatum]|uniref:uncharacterized protein LOC135816219 isoform X2 n=1 Tax=Sycon ciliatum TaxID=27933 RepID=UPI0031F643FA